MLESLQGRLSILFVAFVLLLLISVGATSWGLEIQQQNAIVINLAGRQRMLIQLMARLVAENGSATKDASGTIALLHEAENTFDQTLIALRDGGTAPYLSSSVTLPGTSNVEIRTSIDELDHIWDQFKAELNDVILSSSNISPNTVALESFNFQASALLEQADLVVRLFQAESVSEVRFLRNIQFGFLGMAGALLLVGVWLVRQSLLTPLHELELAAKRLGEDDLETTIQVKGPKEVHSLSNYFELMRVNLRSTRQRLVNLNETLERRVLKRTLELEALNQVSQEIVSQLDVKQVLSSVTEKARDLLDADVATLCLLDSDQKFLELKVLSGPAKAIIDQRITANGEFSTKILEGNRAYQCASETCKSGCQIIDGSYRTSHLAAPLKVDGRVIGAFCVSSPKPDSFSDESAESLTKLANTATVALENARLYAQAEQIAALEERNRIAADIHDGIGQTLGYLGLMTDQAIELLNVGNSADAIGTLHHSREKINEAANETRQAISHLLDKSPANQDLCARLEKSVRNIELQNDLQVEWQNDIEASVTCSGESADQIIKIVLEALTNVIRHAQATKAIVMLNKNENGLQVTIRDNGVGFNVSAAGHNGHFGLQIMRARATHINGRVIVESNPGDGTLVTLSWPETEVERL